jgi:hypothetical protein
MSNFINTIAAIGGVLFFFLFMLGLIVLVYRTFVEMWQERNDFEDPNYEWEEMQ